MVYDSDDYDMCDCDCKECSCEPKTCCEICDNCGEKIKQFFYEDHVDNCIKIKNA
jgi:hypothetical protein